MSWIYDFLSGRTQWVLVDGCSSDNNLMIFGVPQGTVLALLLLLIFINDLPENIASSNFMQMMCSFTQLSSLSMITQFDLQQELNKLQKWAV